MESRRKKIRRVTLIVLLLCSLNCHAEENLADGELHLIEATAYCDSKNLTATQTRVREGIAAFSPKYYGYCALIYDEEMHFLGYYEIQDTGSERIRKGEVIDIWMPTEEECLEFGRQPVYILLVKGQG